MKRWASDQSGQGLVEYAMILVFVVIALITALISLGVSIDSALYTPIVDAFSGFFL